MTPIQSLIDQHRNLMAQAAGVQIEICMALGDRAGAEQARSEMYAHVEARRAARQVGLVGECYFADVGDEIRAGVSVADAVIGAVVT